MAIKYENIVANSFIHDILSLSPPIVTNPPSLTSGVRDSHVSLIVLENLIKTCNCFDTIDLTQFLISLDSPDCLWIHSDPPASESWMSETRCAVQGCGVWMRTVDYLGRLGGVACLEERCQSLGVGFEISEADTTPSLTVSLSCVGVRCKLSLSCCCACLPATALYTMTTMDSPSETASNPPNKCFLLSCLQGVSLQQQSKN